MVEVLIALVLVAIGLLGTASLQVHAMRVGHSAQSRNQAVFLASDIAERMEANKAAAVAGNYVLALTSTSSVAAAQCDVADCDAATLAAWDLSNWGISITTLLPQATSWEMTGLGAGNPVTYTYTITINWTDRLANITYGAAAASGVGINAGGTGERFSYTATRTISN